MDSQTLNGILVNLDQYTASMRHRVEELKREAAKVEDDSGRLKQRITAELMRLTTNNPLRSESARQVKVKYRDKQRSGEEHAKSLRDTAQAIERHLHEVETVHSELRRHEAYMRDMETKVNAWVARAQDLMSQSPN